MFIIKKISSILILKMQSAYQNVSSPTNSDDFKMMIGRASAAS